jgi:hypothetical protein
MMHIKEKQKVEAIFKNFRVGVGLFSFQNRGERESFIFPAFSLVRVNRKDNLKEFETTIKMAPSIRRILE